MTHACGHDSCGAQQAMLQVAEQIERVIDDEMDRIDNIDEDDILALRRQRLSQLKEMQKRRDHWCSRGHGLYHDITDPKHFFDCCKDSERVVCHFVRRTTSRCQVLDRHLSFLAKIHFETRFCYVDVEKLPHLAEKFNVVMLPHVMLVEKQNTFHSIIGFDDFGGNDDFNSETVEAVLCNLGMLNDRDMFAADQKE